MKKIMILILLLLVLIFSAYNCNAQENEAYDLHEWGVFVAGYDCDSSSALTNSPSIMFVFKPLLYFHSLNNQTDVNIEVDSIINTTTIPQADIDDDKIIWNVSVVKDWIQIDASDEYEYGPYEYHKYLFYEGEIQYSPNIYANITTDGINATFTAKNNEDYKISDVYFVYGNYKRSEILDYNHYGLTFVYLDEMESNQEKTISVLLDHADTEEFENLSSSLVNQGLTQNEADDMITNWTYFWFGSGGNIGPFANLFYTIPQTTYDELLPISIEPSPNEIKRVGIFTITEIPVPKYVKEESSGEISTGPEYEEPLKIDAMGLVWFILLGFTIMVISMFLYHKMKKKDKIPKINSSLVLFLGSISIFLFFILLSKILGNDTYENYDLSSLYTNIWLTSAIVAFILFITSAYLFLKQKIYANIFSLIGCILLMSITYEVIENGFYPRNYFSEYWVEVLPELIIFVFAAFVAFLSIANIGIYLFKKMSKKT